MKMKSPLVPGLVIGLSLLLVSTGALASECDSKCQKSAINDYFERLDGVYRKGSTGKDIDALFTLFDEQVRYEHIEYQADFDREQWIKAFNRNLQKGVYGADQGDRIKVVNYIFGKSHVAVEYVYGMIAEDGSWREKKPERLFALFGFTGDKISLVREYW